MSGHQRYDGSIQQKILEVEKASKKQSALDRIRCNRLRSSFNSKFKKTNLKMLKDNINQNVMIEARKATRADQTRWLED